MEPQSGGSGPLWEKAGDSSIVLLTPPHHSLLPHSPILSPKSPPTSPPTTLLPMPSVGVRFWHLLEALARVTCHLSKERVTAVYFDPWLTAIQWSKLTQRGLQDVAAKMGSQQSGNNQGVCSNTARNELKSMQWERLRPKILRHSNAKSAALCKQCALLSASLSSQGNRISDEQDPPLILTHLWPQC